MIKPPTSSKSITVVWRSWRRILYVASAIIILGLTAAIHYSAAVASRGATPEELQRQVRDLTLQVKQLMQERKTPAAVVDRYRDSIGYVYGSYRVGFAHQQPEIRARVSGTGFLLVDDLIATNRHVAEPWYGDSDAEKLITHGAKPVMESLVIFFPGSLSPVPLWRAAVSKTSDLAILRAENSPQVRGRAALPLAGTRPSAGEPVVVIGYPLGISGMIAKSPPGINQRFADRPKDLNVARKLAELSLIRPFISCGHLGDIVGDKLIYDAPTAHGGSGGPVFNSQGEVIAVNSAYMDGFSGGSMGLAVELLEPLLREARALHPPSRGLPREDEHNDWIPPQSRQSMTSVVTPSK